MTLNINFADSLVLSKFMGTNKISIILEDEKGKRTSYDVSLSLLNFKKPEVPTV